MHFSSPYFKLKHTLLSLSFKVNIFFMFTHIVIFPVFFFLLHFTAYIWDHFSLVWRTLLGYITTGLFQAICLSFPLFDDIFILSSLLNNIFVWYRILDWCLTFFSTFKDLFPLFYGIWYFSWEVSWQSDCLNSSFLWLFFEYYMFSNYIVIYLDKFFFWYLFYLFRFHASVN